LWQFSALPEGFCLKTTGDSLTNFVTFPETRSTGTQELAYPSPRAKTSNSVTFSGASSPLKPSVPAQRIRDVSGSLTYPDPRSFDDLAEVGLDLVGSFLIEGGFELAVELLFSLLDAL
jgi:hypothetical protein